MNNVRSNIVSVKSVAFSVRIVNMCTVLPRDRREYIMSKQLMRCGTSVGANISEAVYGQSKADFIAKMQIALKEANECGYWFEVLHKTGIISDKERVSIEKDQRELLKLLITILKNAKKTNL